MDAPIRWKAWHTAVLVLFVPGIIGVVAWYWAPVAAWIATMALLVISIFLGGYVITGVPRGLFVDERNKVSLSRFQAVLWMVLILPAFLVAAIANIRLEVENPLTVSVPEELWLVLGISGTALVGAGLAKSLSASRTPDVPAVSQATGVPAMRIATVGDTAVDRVTNEPLAKGQLDANPRAQDSAWSDMFKGEQTGKSDFLDLSKVQMFYFTLLLVLGYGVAVGRLLSTEGPFDSLPVVDAGFVALLAISQGAYLLAKVPTPVAGSTTPVSSAQSSIGQSVSAQTSVLPTPPSSPMVPALATFTPVPTVSTSHGSTQNAESLPVALQVAPLPPIDSGGALADTSPAPTRSPSEPLALPGVDPGTQLASRFEMHGSIPAADGEENASTGMGLDTALVLYVSVRIAGQDVGTLQYALSSFETRGGQPTEEDKLELLQRAQPRIMSDLAALRRGERPDALRGPRAV